MQSRLDRWSKMKSELESHGIKKYTRENAVVPTWQNFHKYSESCSPFFLKYTLECHPSYSLGTIGIFESHLSLWKKCASNDTPFLIFEDDIFFTRRNENFQKWLKHTLDDIKQDFDLISFFPNKACKKVTHGEMFLKTIPPMLSAYAYLIHPNFAKKLLPLMSKKVMPFDIQVSILCPPSTTKVYLTKNYPIHTDIHEYRDSNVFQPIRKRNYDAFDMKKNIPFIHILTEKETDLNLEVPFIKVRQPCILNLKKVFCNHPSKILKIFYKSDLLLYIHHCHSKEPDSICIISLTKDQKETLFPAH